ncbi:MAG: flotillin family protein [Candidatus Methylomirabilales bacterium]
MIGWIILIGILAAVIIAAFTAWYVKTPVNNAFIRTGFGGKKVVIDGGAVVLPWVQSIQWISLETFKLQVFKAKKEAFITKDRLRVDLGAEFYVKISADPESIERASRSLGDKSFSAEGIQSLVEEKLVSALRSAAAQMEMVYMHENRRGFALSVMEHLGEPLMLNGLGLEDVSIFHFDQTDRAQLDPHNIFDAEGLRQIAAQVSQRNRERNEIERNTEVGIKRKDVEAVKLKLSLDQDREFAEAEQMRQVDTNRSLQKAETEQYKFEQDRRTREAEIAKQRAVREAEIVQEKAVREAEIRREAYLIQQMELRETAEVEKERVVEETKRAKEIAILVKERQRIEEEKRRLEAEAVKELSAQEVVTVAEKASAERQKVIALIQALREVEVAEQKARAVERLALSKQREGEADAAARLKMVETENHLQDKVIQRDVLLRFIDRAPQILGEMMAPARQIDSIKVLDVRGLGGNGEGAGPDVSGISRVVNSFLNAGAALPLLREFLDFAKMDPEGMLKKVAAQIPGAKEAVEPPSAKGSGK